MAKVKSFKAEFGTSVEIRGTWYKFNSGIELEVEPNDDVAEVKERAWNTVIHEVDKQIRELTQG